MVAVSFAMHYAIDIGLRYLRSEKRSTVSVITFVAVAGVALGVAALLTVMSITSGFQEQFRNKVLGVNAHVLVLKYGLDFEEYREVIADAEAIPGVLGAAPFRIDDMMLAKGDRVSGVLVKGVDPSRLKKVLDLPDQIVEGSLKGLRAAGAKPPAMATVEFEQLDDDEGFQSILDQVRREKEGLRAASSKSKKDNVKQDRVPTVSVPSLDAAEAALDKTSALGPGLSDDEENALFDETDAIETQEQGSAKLGGVIVGQTLAENLGIEVGDQVSVYSPVTGLDVSMWAPSQSTPKSQNFIVTGIFKAGFQEYDSRLVYVDLYASQAFFDQGDTVTGVELRLSNIENAPNVARKLERKLGEGPYHTMDWRELNHNLFTALEIQKVALSLVIATIILVAAFNVIATLIMIVLEKKKEIAILKAMGAKKRNIMAMFGFQGAVIGGVGTFLGLILGGGVCAYLSRYKFALDPKVYLVDHLPVRISLAEFVLTTVVALSICSLATLLPSFWASRLAPAEGVRYE
ncbi:MAG: ABC transporter permease [Myxococcales bacterium]|nr:MAG: ABC transporter permease [Myxococcales bacterium]